MFERFVKAFIIYLVVIDPIGNAPIFLAVTEVQKRARTLHTALEGTAIATAIMMFFALCGAWILGYLNITEAAFKIAGGIILFLGSILLMMVSMLLFTREIQIANRALDVHLSDLETHQEWEKYLKLKHPRRAATRT